jgi:hypothetical protein
MCKSVAAMLSVTSVVGGLKSKQVAGISTKAYELTFNLFSKNTYVTFIALSIKFNLYAVVAFYELAGAFIVLKSSEFKDILIAGLLAP